MSRREVRLPNDGGIVRVENTMFEISLGSMPPETIIAELLLLSEGLVPELSLRHLREETKVRLSVTETHARSVGTIMDDGLHLGLSRTELESWIAFFLRYYRDGVAQVNHLDLEAHRVDNEAETVDVILRVG